MSSPVPFIYSVPVPSRSLPWRQQWEQSRQCRICHMELSPAVNEPLGGPASSAHESWVNCTNQTVRCGLTNPEYMVKVGEELATWLTSEFASFNRYEFGNHEHADLATMLLSANIWLWALFHTVLCTSVISWFMSNMLLALTSWDTYRLETLSVLK